MTSFALPEAFSDNIRARLGDEADLFFRAINSDAIRGIRINPLKKASRVPNGLGSPIPWEPTGYYLDSNSDAGAVVLHELGAWYLQDPSAMLPAAVLNAQPGEKVLDLCAAPGGKATQSGLRMKGEGLLVCNEPVLKRAQVLSRNLERMGIINALVVSSTPEHLADRWPGGFDAVLVDAPCSGEGMFRKYPETRLEWTSQTPQGCAARQADILDSAAVLVRKGGRIVYSTCTLNPIENEDTVAAFLKRHADFSLVPFELPDVQAPEGIFTCWPHKFSGEGQFTALLQRMGNDEAYLPEDRSLPKPSKDMLKALADFASNAAAQSVSQFGSLLVRMPFLPDCKGLKLLRCGLHLG